MKKIIISFVVLLFVQALPAQTPAQLKSWMPDVPGWELAEEIEVFDPDNLFDRINGAAPLFIENNFREMTSMEYKKGDDYITVQAYRHATPEDAFGMYASERSSELEYVDIGGEAQGDARNLFFFAGSIYVKMWTNSTDDVKDALYSIGKTFSGKIDPDAGYPVIVKSFPAKDKVPYSEAYITSSYIGHEFLKSVYIAKYKIDNQDLQLFVIDGKSKEGAKSVLTNYFTFTKQPLEFAEGELLIKDRYNGDIPVIWKDKYIIGIYNESGTPVEGTAILLKDLSEKLK
ncbi:MAG: hypothetical protein LBV72_06225 [Tannerella sp.]|jgi:hypothetical protein|nr:hypothetical protein [Tannerella sp.]